MPITNQELLKYANDQIAKHRLGEGGRADSPLLAFDVDEDYDASDGSIYMTGAIWVDTYCRTREQVDAEVAGVLEALADGDNLAKPGHGK